MSKPEIQEEQSLLDEEQQKSEEQQTKQQEATPQSLLEGVGKIIPSSNLQIKPKATGYKLRDFEVFLCVTNLRQVGIPNTDKTRWSLESVNVGEKLYDRKVEPHLVYGSKQFNTVGFNDQILLDLGIPVQLWFPKDTAKNGDKLLAGDVIIKVLVNQGGRTPIISERKFNLFQDKGSKTLKEMAAEIRAEYEYKAPEAL